MLHRKRTVGAVTRMWASLAIPVAAAAAQRFVGTPAGHTINGGPRRDVRLARAGNDTVNGCGRPDWIRGNRGDDVLRGDLANVGAPRSRDRIWGGPGNDQLFGGDGRDRLS